jgi:hypothetical protein
VALINKIKVMRKKITPILLFLSIFTQIQAQQAWTRAKGSYYTQLGISYLKANKLLNGLENSTPLNRDVTDITTQFYGEYGLTNRLTLSTQIPLKLLSVNNTSPLLIVKDGSLTALSNIQAALTANFLNKNGYVLSGKTNISLPTAKFHAETGLRSGFDAFSFTPSLMVGFGHAKFFTSAEIGYVLRNNKYSDRILAAAQIGKFLGKKKKLLAILNMDLMKSRENGTYDDYTSSNTGLYLDEQSYLSPGLKFGYKATTKTMIWLSVGGGVGGVTRNIAASPGLSFSVSYQ